MAFQNHEGQVRSFQMPAYFWYRRAERSREEGQPVRALSLLRHAARQEPEEREWRLEYAWQLTRLACCEASNRECLDLLARWPAAFSAFGLLTLNMMALGRISECMDAYSIYTQFIRLHPSATPEWDEDVYEAEDLLFSSNREPKRFHRLESLLRMAGKCMLRGDVQRAGKLLVRSRTAPFYAPNPERECMIASYLFRTGQKEAALETLRAALRSGVRSSSTLLSMALLLHQLDAPDWKPALLSAALHLKTPLEESEFCHVADHFHCGYVAVGLLRRTLKEQPTRLCSAYNLCVLSLRQGDLAEGVRLAHLLRELDPLDRQVEGLFRLVQEWEKSGADAEEARQAGQERLCFYGLPDERLAAEDALEFFSRLTGQPGEFFSALKQDARLRGQFLRMLHGHPELYQTLPALCAEMPEKDAQTLLRRLLLDEPESMETVRLLSHLLECFDCQPPYLVRRTGHLTLFDPYAPEPEEPAFLQRMCFRRLREIRSVLGGAALPAALAVQFRLTEKERYAWAGDRMHVWAAAFVTVYSQKHGKPVPRLDGTMLSFPERWKAYRRAVSSIRRAWNEKGSGNHGRNEEE